MTAWKGLTPPYSTIVADPPWHYDEGWQGWTPKEKKLPYSSMSLAEIAALPIVDLAAPGAHLYLWTTGTYLPHVFGIVEMWGFIYSTTLTWCKTPSANLGGRFTSTTEYVIHASAPRENKPRQVERAGALIRAAREAAGLTRAEVFHRVRGRKLTGLVSNWEADICLPTVEDWAKLQSVLPTLADVPRPVVPPAPRKASIEPVAGANTTWWNWARGPHSAKPPAFLDVVESVSPGPYVELFARAPRLGWDSWGKGYESEVA